MNGSCNDECGADKPCGPRAVCLVCLILLLAAAGAVGAMVYRRQSAASPNGSALPGKIWTCTEHPEIERYEPGHCPICGRILVEEYRGPQPTVGSRAELPETRVKAGETTSP
jgi:hypothetical protein